MIDVVFKGLGAPAQYAVPEGSPYYNAKHATACVASDPAEANRLLDEIGLNKRAADGTRLFWDGKTPVVMDVNTTAERPLEAVQLACRYWQAVGVNAQMKVLSQTMINRLINMGTLDIGVHKEGGNFFGPLMAGGFAPTHPAECPQWGEWCEWMDSLGTRGTEPPQRMKDLSRMWDDVVFAPSRAAMMSAWQRLSERTADELPVIGVMTSPGQPVYVKRGFRNVPKLALAGWIAHQPGNCCPEAFFWDEGAE
jgi:peptide/nickel transport system substrate-binding protein